MSPNGRGTWWARPIPSLQRRATLARVTSSPRNATVPADGRSAPERTFRSVVLPAPLAPTMPTASPAPTAKSSPSSAPNLLRIPAAARIGVDSDPTAHPMLRVVRLELCLDRDVLVVAVLAEHPLEPERAAPGLDPLPARDRRLHDVRDRALAPA